ncbi:Hypothetical protein I595_2931 [Croceitalea dokdonensis DOKDO 023]|uniref:Uncharacterized protein n=1 Tax=Croceitalea dokdonensis DOKDO 023 TaxID=1300341 RepID=A0A0P7AZE0_9FLAO|nr:hypothetical protein [Croceitalea dokdonensis]KPM30952.1 Hypothetical protein I595_2931 [Croceitalea dokdonensis DOKDO 023]
MANQANQNNNDEIDLGQLFQLIGRGVQKISNFFAAIIKSLFAGLIAILLFIQNNALVLIISAILGAAAGYILDNILPEKYISKMVVEPNFNSVQQLYNNIDFYNDLADAKDSIALSNALSISVTRAAEIKEIFVESYSDENQKIKLFDDFIRELDSTTVSALDYQSYLENFNSMDARFHQISVVSTDNTVAKKIQPAIVSSISVNSYFKLQKQISDSNLDLQERIYLQQLQEIDSLQKLYKTVLVKEAEKPMQGTNINLAENGESQNKELALVQERDVLKNRLVQLNQERANKSEIINIISDFPSRGVKLKGFWNRYVYFLPVFLVVGMIFLLLVRNLNTFLKTKHGNVAKA